MSVGLATGHGVWTQPKWNQHRIRWLWRYDGRHYSNQLYQRYKKPCHSL